MKKICYITTKVTTLDSFVFPLLDTILEKTDWKISVICDDEAAAYGMVPKGIDYFPVSMERGISLTGIKAMLQMYRIFKREKFDLIQYSTPNAALYASLAGWLAHVPVRLYCQWGMAYVGMSGFNRKIFKLEEKLVCALSTWIEPDSKSNLEFAHKEGLYPTNKGSVVGCGSASGINLSKFDCSQKEKYRKDIRETFGIGADTYVFGYVGRITRDKGMNELFQAFQRLLSCQKDIVLLMVGGLENEGLLDQNLLKWAQNSERIIFTGEVTDVEKYLSAMDCFILPSYREGFGMGTIEAEAMEVPVIVTDIPGPIDAMVPNVTGKTVKKKDVDSLYNAMVQIRELACADYGKAGRVFVERSFEQQHLIELIIEDRKRLLSSE